MDNVELSFEDLAPVAGVVRPGFTCLWMQWILNISSVDGHCDEERSQVSARPITKRVALQEALSPDVARCERGWKLLMAAPRMCSCPNFLEGCSSAKRS